MIDDRLFRTSRVYSIMTLGAILFSRTPVMINDNTIDVVINPTRSGELAN